MIKETLVGDGVEVFQQKRSRVSYGIETLNLLLKHMTFEDLAEHDMISISTPALRKYFEEHPEIYKNYCEGYKRKFGMYPNENTVASGFLAQRKKSE